MLSDTLQDILKRIVNKYKVDSEVLENVLEYVQTKPLHSYVYPEVVEDKLGIDITQCMKLFIYLEKFGLLKQVYKLYCPNCKDFSGTMYESLNDLEEANECEFCGKDLFEEENPYKFVVVYFRVIKNV